MGIMCTGCQRKCSQGFTDAELIYHHWARMDAYGVYTGLYCWDCYNSGKYPYRKDYYHDPAYAGERMDSDE